MKKILFSNLLMLLVVVSIARQGNAARSTLAAATGPEGVFSSLEVKVFPNPVLNKQFTIELNNQLIREIRITNIAGILVYHKEFSSPVSRSQVILEDFQNGIYLLKVISAGNNSKTIKLLVSNGQ